MNDAIKNTTEPSPSADKITKPAAPKRKTKSNASVGLKTVIISSVIAAVIGASGGAWLANSGQGQNQLMAAEKTQSALSKFESDIQSLASRTKALEAQQSELEQTLETRASDMFGSRKSEKSEDIATLGKELIPMFEDIEARLLALEAGETRPSPEKEDGSSDVTPERGKSDLSQIRKDLSALQERLENETQSFVSKNDLDKLKKRVRFLETEFEKAPVLIPPFPREAVMDAIMGKSESSENWMTGLLGKKVRVIDADMVARLDRIEKHVEAGDISAIKDEMVYLPEETKSVTDNWLKQFD